MLSTRKKVALRRKGMKVLSERRAHVARRVVGFIVAEAAMSLSIKMMCIMVGGMLVTEGVEMLLEFIDAA